MAEQSQLLLGFIHIPRTGGTSVTRAIVDAGLPIRVADHSYPARVAQEEFTVLRDPFDRFVSAFRYGRTRWPNAVNARFDSASLLAEAAADPAHPLHAVAWAEIGNRPEDFLARGSASAAPQTVLGAAPALCWVYAPQSTWLVNQPRYLLRHERLDRDFAELLGRHGLPAVALPALNGSNAVGPEALSASAAEFVAGLYARDLLAYRALQESLA